MTDLIAKEVLEAFGLTLDDFEHARGKLYEPGVYDHLKEEDRNGMALYHMVNMLRVRWWCEDNPE